jgi:hypothetical protein
MEWGKMRRFWSLLDPQFAALGERVEEESSETATPAFESARKLGRITKT